MEIEVLYAHNSKPAGKFSFKGSNTVADVKKELSLTKPKLTVHRQAMRLDVKGKTLKDSDTLDALNLRNGSKLYVKDLGPQIGWKTVFLAEYAGPLLVYLWFYARPGYFYGADAGLPISQVTHIAAGCYSVHYIKRLLETIFVHRFSHATMPMRNLFKNCSYYWLFTAYVAYHVNHPKFTPPHQLVSYAALLGFIISEFGNFSIHINLRNLRPPGSTVRKVPTPDSNPMTMLFHYVSCPNYTYEFLSWLSFSIMTSCIPAYLFAAAGMYQMTMWAIGKHKNYRKEFPDYPKRRKAILPFIL